MKQKFNGNEKHIVLKKNLRLKYHLDKMRSLERPTHINANMQRNLTKSWAQKLFKIKET
jgi:hypothetical protein